MGEAGHHDFLRPGAVRRWKIPRAAKNVDTKLLTPWPHVRKSRRETIWSVVSR